MMNTRTAWTAFAALLFVHTLLWGGSSVLAQEKLVVPADLIGMWQGSIVKDFESWGAFITVVGGSSSEPVATLGIREELDWCMYTLPLENVTRSEGALLRIESDSLWAHDRLSICGEGSLRMKIDELGRLIVDAEWDDGASSSGNVLVRLDDGSTAEVCNPEVLQPQNDAGKEALDFIAMHDPSILGMWQGVFRGDKEKWNALLTIVGGGSSFVEEPVAVVALQTEAEVGTQICVHVLEQQESRSSNSVLMAKTKFHWDRTFSFACGSEVTLFKFEVARHGTIAGTQMDTDGNVLMKGTMARMDDGSTAEVCALMRSSAGNSGK